MGVVLHRNIPRANVHSPKVDDVLLTLVTDPTDPGLSDVATLKTSAFSPDELLKWNGTTLVTVPLSVILTAGAEVSGILPVANGGSGVNTLPTNKFVTYDGSTLVAAFDQNSFLSATADDTTVGNLTVDKTLPLLRLDGDGAGGTFASQGTAVVLRSGTGDSVGGVLLCAGYEEGFRVGTGYDGSETPTHPHALFNSSEIVLVNDQSDTGLKFNDGISDYTIWHAKNDGAGSGLDSDLLDGQEGAFYTNLVNMAAGVLPIARGGTNNTTFDDNQFLSYDSGLGKVVSSGIRVGALNAPSYVIHWRLRRTTDIAVQSSDSRKLIPTYQLVTTPNNARPLPSLLQSTGIWDNTVSLGTALATGEYSADRGTFVITMSARIAAGDLSNGDTFTLSLGGADSVSSPTTYQQIGGVMPYEKTYTHTGDNVELLVEAVFVYTQPGSNSDSDDLRLCAMIETSSVSAVNVLEFDFSISDISPTA